MVSYTVSPHSDLYPLMDRQINIDLIKAALYAQNQDELDLADCSIAEKMHPSLLAELDWMEKTMPKNQQAQASGFVDGLFIHHLPLIISQRRTEFDLPDTEFSQEVKENWDFYRFIIDGYPEVTEILGRKDRIKEILQEVGEKFVLSHQADKFEANRARALFSEIHDRRWISIMVNAEIENCMARALDHVSSRFRAKEFFRHIGNQMPQVGHGEIDSPQSLQAFTEELRSLARETEKYGLLRLSTFCTQAALCCDDLNLNDIDVYRGERAGGYGHCGDCAMMYAGTSIISFDPSCPDLLETEQEHERVVLPLNFSTTTCCFCGRLQRVESASIFYSSRRQQIIINLPLLGQFTKEEAANIHSELVKYLFDRYRKQCSEEEATAFDSANEQLTYATSDFLYAIQMGTTAREEHIYSVLELADGSGILMDETKGMLMGLTPSEVAKQQVINTQQPGGDCVTSTLGITKPVDSSDETLASMRDAMDAYKRNEYELAQSILEALLEKSPNDDVLRRNLAVVYFSQGFKDKAKNILGG
ncbi:MAG: tetratricopeptide repeat protein [Alteromonadales bacterium]|nr:tetratricopeptide repeat protein [Alteromonadales bacterium]